MKFIKLALIFIVLVGGILLVSNLKSIFPTKNQQDEFCNEDLIDITEVCNNIRKEWEASQTWDETLYHKHREDINQSKNMGLFSKTGYNTVNNALRETATNKACKAYLDELKKNDFSHARLNKHYKGVLFIKDKEALEKDERVIRVEDIHRLYSQIYAFSQNPHYITARYDTLKQSWYGFTALQNQIVDKAATYKKHKLYSEVMQIPGFSKALNEQSLKVTTDKQRPQFYENLSRQIVGYFQTQEATPENRSRLESIIRQFNAEEKRHGVSNLTQYLVDLIDEINQKEKVNETAL